MLIEKSVGIREERESLYTLFSLVSVLVLDNGVEHSQKGEIKTMMGFNFIILGHIPERVCPSTERIIHPSSLFLFSQKQGNRISLDIYQWNTA